MRIACETPEHTALVVSFRHKQAPQQPTAVYNAFLLDVALFIQDSCALAFDGRVVFRKVNPRHFQYRVARLTKMKQIILHLLFDFLL